MNVIVRLEFELFYYDIAVKHLLTHRWDINQYCQSKKQTNYGIEDDGYTNCNWSTWNNPKSIDKKPGRLENEWGLSKLLQYQDRPEYWEESCRLEEACCHAHSSEKPPANADVKYSQGVK